MLFERARLPQARLLAAVTIALAVCATFFVQAKPAQRTTLQVIAERKLSELLPATSIGLPAFNPVSPHAGGIVSADSIATPDSRHALWWKLSDDSTGFAAAMEVRTKSGTISFLALFSHSGNIRGVHILSTTGKVNSRLRSFLWQRSIERLPDLEKLVPGKNIDVVSGASLSVQSLCDALNMLGRSISGDAVDGTR